MLSVLMASNGGVEEQIQHTQHEQRHDHRPNDAANHDGGEGTLHLRSHPLAERHRQKAKTGDEGCH